MTTLPPEGDGNTTPEQPGTPAPEQPGGTTPPPPNFTPPAPGGYAPPAPPTPGYAPPAPGAAQPAPGYTPPAPGAAQPAPGYAQPAPGYAQPPGYGAPQGQPGQPGQPDPMGNLTLNYWLSVFFVWLPALIFYLIEKDRATPQVRALHAANLNFALMRTGLIVIGWVVGFVPFMTLLLGVAHIILFVFHIIAAAKVSETYRSGGGDPFMFNIPMVR